VAGPVGDSLKNINSAINKTREALVAHSIQIDRLVAADLLTALSALRFKTVLAAVKDFRTAPSRKTLEGVRDSLQATEAAALKSAHDIAVAARKLDRAWRAQGNARSKIDSYDLPRRLQNILLVKMSGGLYGTEQLEYGLRHFTELVVSTLARALAEKDTAKINKECDEIVEAFEHFNEQLAELEASIAELDDLRSPTSVARRISLTWIVLFVGLAITVYWSWDRIISMLERAIDIFIWMIRMGA
jgi:hypothetical protein